MNPIQIYSFSIIGKLVGLASILKVLKARRITTEDKPRSQNPRNHSSLMPSYPEGEEVETPPSAK